MGSAAELSFVSHWLLAENTNPNLKEYGYCFPAIQLYRPSWLTIVSLRDDRGLLLSLGLCIL